MQDLRPLAETPSPANRLSDDERDQIVATCNGAEFASLPPSQIVPRLADRGIYIASESSFCRVLRQRGQNHRCGRARAAARSKPPATFEAKARGRSGRGTSPGFLDQRLGCSIASTSSRTSSAGRSSAGKFTSVKAPNWPHGFPSARSGRRGASPAPLHCMPTTAAR